MTTINILEFENYSGEMFLDFLKIQNSPAIEITIPKEFDGEDELLMFCDYSRAAYVGQLLYPLAEDFMHNLPPPATTGTFEFIIIGFDPVPMAKVLWVISKGYNINDVDAANSFNEDAENYLAKITNGDFACPVFIDIINELNHRMGH